MTVFIATVIALCTTMLLLGVGTALRRRTLRASCGRGDDCCRRGDEPAALAKPER